MLYIEKKQIKKKCRQNKCYKKNTFFSKELQPSSQYSFNFKYFYELKAKGSSILEKFVWGFYFPFYLGFTKIYFYFKGVSKNCESVKEGKKFF